jgi:hypothetical protein
MLPVKWHDRSRWPKIGAVPRALALVLGIVLIGGALLALLVSPSVFFEGEHRHLLLVIWMGIGGMVLGSVPIVTAIIGRSPRA